jgi:hypothetical protein
MLRNKGAFVAAKFTQRAKSVSAELANELQLDVVPAAFAKYLLKSSRMVCRSP